MPGVFRPYTLADVLGTINQQSQDAGTADVINGLGFFAETDEQATMSDSVTVTHSATPGWDQSTWGNFLWG